MHHCCKKNTKCDLRSIHRGFVVHATYVTRQLHIVFDSITISRTMTHTHTSPIASNLLSVKEAIAKATKKWQRNADDVTLVAVSKFHSAEAIQEALLAGHRTYGENRVQEAADKWPALKNEHPDICLHLIGPLQSNKAKQALELFDVIETIDRPKLVDEITKHLPKLSKTPLFYVQVNVGDESQKAGVAIEELDTLLAYCTKKGLAIAGLMCIPPVDQPPAPYFALLRKLANQHHINHLSMGMSGDFEEAISLGATHVRVGTAIFGERH